MAFALAAFAAVLAWLAFRTQAHSDFGSVWFGARAMLEHRDPYHLIGRGKEFEQWPLLYPAPALVAALPLVPFSERTATMLFVGLSTFLLALGATRKGWHLLPMFTTQAFVSSASLGQWSIVMTAALFFPSLAFLSVGKPQASIPILLATSERVALLAAGFGVLILGAASLFIFPMWPASWLANVRAARNMTPPVAHFGGFLVLFALARWRRSEAWLLVGTACLPQSWGWYGTLALFTIPANLRESVLLAAVAVAGGALAAFGVPDGLSNDTFLARVGAVIVLTVYLPATFLILRRPNKGESPAWLRAFQKDIVSR
ncbi:MAG TPA: hypothetical protein VHM24_00335 [Gemmatimonadaceae bacterium]|nr:hypothetical protein [Gemmatimonadaceae bacterium]